MINGDCVNWLMNVLDNWIKVLIVFWNNLILVVGLVVEIEFE